MSKAELDKRQTCNGTCQHRDCKYFAGVYSPYRCNYMLATGRSRIKWHRERGLSTAVKDCRCYEKGEKERAARKFDAPIKTEPPKQYTTGRVKTKTEIRRKDEAPAIKSKLIKKEANRKAKDEIDGKIAQMVLAGKTDGEIAAALGLSKIAVERRRQRLGIFRRPQHPAEKRAEKKKLWRVLYSEGFGVNKIAELTQSSSHSVARWRDSSDLPPLKMVGITNAEKERRKKLLEELGLSETGKGGKQNEPVDASR